MSQEYMLQAVRDALRAEYGLDRTGCQVTADGRPDPDAGEWFYAVHPGGASNSARLYLDERIDGIAVTVTRRTGFAPQDRLGEEVLIEKDGILRVAGRVAVLLHMNYGVMDAANALIDGFAATTNGFVEPLGYQNTTYLGPQGPNWFFAEGVDDACTGIAVQVTFGGARRIRYPGNDDDT